MGRTSALAPPLRYAPGSVDGMSVLAYDAAGAGRIVEVLGDLDRAEHVAVVVPGNAHDLGNYRCEDAGASPRGNGRTLHRAVAAAAPDRPGAVLVWLGYRCPRGFVAGLRRTAAAAGAHDLRSLVTRLSPRAHVTLVGHSYGSLVCAQAVAGTRSGADLVALASPGLGVRSVAELRTDARVWATRGPDDWVRYVPRFRLGDLGHGRQPTDAGFGARVFSSHDAIGHSGYYAAGSEALRNLARIVLGRYDEVTPA